MIKLNAFVEYEYMGAKVDSEGWETATYLVKLCNKDKFAFILVDSPVFPEEEIVPFDMHDLFRPLIADYLLYDFYERDYDNFMQYNEYTISVEKQNCIWEHAEMNSLKLDEVYGKDLSHFIFTFLHAGYIYGLPTEIERTLSMEDFIECMLENLVARQKKEGEDWYV